MLVLFLFFIYTSHKGCSPSMHKKEKRKKKTLLTSLKCVDHSNNPVGGFILSLTTPATAQILQVRRKSEDQKLGTLC